MSNILLKLLLVGRLAVVVVAISALTLSGAASAKRLHVGYGQADRKAEAETDPARIVPGPPAPEDVPENMTPSGKPNGEPTATISSPLIAGPDSNGSRTKGVPCTPLVWPGAQRSLSNRIAVMATTSLVSSQLGLQFTLVGAKPSGTS